MAITGQSPVEGALIDASSTVEFTIDDTYTYLRIEVTTASGVEYAYDSSLGGQQSGYVVTVIDNGDSTETFQFSADSGFDITPQLISVVEDETGTEATTVMTWLLNGQVDYPNDDNPYYSEQGGGFQLSEDNASVVVNVSHLDFLAGSEDGITVTDLGGGKVRLTARAATTDPDAVHVNVANEISGITEKVLPDNEDLVIIEDVSASGVKKSVQKSNMGGARLPQKFSTNYDCTSLYLFNGNMNEEVTGTHPMTTQLEGSLYYCNGMVPEARALYQISIDGSGSTPGTMTSTKVMADSDWTIQCIFHPGKAKSVNGIVDAWLFTCREDIDNDIIWAMGFPAQGSPSYVGLTYKIGSESFHLWEPTDFVLADGMPCHYVIRHWDAGGGSWTNEIIINNTLVATETGAPAMHPYWADGDYSMTVGKYQNDRGLFRTSIDGCKASNRKLTDVEVEIEFRKVMGYPVS